ncbi:DUF948 domain-containing protein [Heyndrickxia oleronia]|uniref:DUF948 domain-containing protein n=1 Tax=Heyndrickxia oleronia TaxID=38875 RepID=UPI00203A8422|nr:DUF948 domain-containing protein [Heyndrickxia oleronia]MCI1591413.1 hypothetical protein [Heyndrickxia oleronia]MCI1613859.1 hypothetical protein [Heyndrickxia oleronia]MCI1744989.1 hypothetical protein [Heyndrickxia oleronia]MCI1761795.1 hypothetical protein [Heyndrickxia oleronia]MCM3239109.1 hypothetical protein [Heyndrickxia oleronia]
MEIQFIAGLYPIIFWIFLVTFCIYTVRSIRRSSDIKAKQLERIEKKVDQLLNEQNSTK